MKISFLGVRGTYSHQVIAENFPQAEEIPCKSFEGAFEAVHEGRADMAVIPIENSTYGRVADVHHLLPDAGLHIIGEHFIRVRIHWVVRQDQEKEKIKKAISHPMLLGQCRRFLIENKLEWESFGDTASAAEFVSLSDDASISALSSEFAGKIYGLKTLAENVEDSEENTTRFLVLSKDKNHALQGEKIITSFIFDVRNIPAALYKALGGFATNGVNMTKLESYMIGGKFSATQFYAEIEGHPEDEAVKLAMEELAFFTDHVRILGVFEASSFRKSKS